MARRGRGGREEEKVGGGKRSGLRDGFEEQEG